MGKFDITQFVPYAQDVEKQYGIPSSITLGQLMLESGGSGTGGLSGLANIGKNLFGIKAGSSWDGEVYTSMTHEEVNGKDQVVNARFRKYSSWGESFKDYGELLSGDRYRSYTSGVNTVEGYAHAIKNAGYATDSAYADKLISVINSNNLNQYNVGKWNDVSQSASTGSWLDYVPIVGTSTTVAESQGVTLDKGITTVISVIAVVAVVVLAVIFIFNALKSTGGNENGTA